jgi:hypothetical protein
MAEMPKAKSLRSVRSFRGMESALAAHAPRTQIRRWVVNAPHSWVRKDQPIRDTYSVEKGSVTSSIKWDTSPPSCWVEPGWCTRGLPMVQVHLIIILSTRALASCVWNWRSPLPLYYEICWHGLTGSPLIAKSRSKKSGKRPRLPDPPLPLYYCRYGTRYDIHDMILSIACILYTVWSLCCLILLHGSFPNLFQLASMPPSLGVPSWSWC